MSTKFTNINYAILGLISIDLVLFLITEPYFKSLNGGLFSDYENQTIEPFFYGSLMVLLCLVVLRYFKGNYYHLWLKYIASWYMPVAVFFISQISVYSSSILAIDRTTAAVYWMGGLFLITCAFISYRILLVKK